MIIEIGDRGQPTSDFKTDETHQNLQKYVDNCFLSYIMDVTKSLEGDSAAANIFNIIRNLSAATVLQFKLMEQSDNNFREETVRCIENSPEGYAAVFSLTSFVCVLQFNGII